MFTPELDDEAWKHNGRTDTQELIVSSLFPSPPPESAAAASSSSAKASHNKMPKTNAVEPTAPAKPLQQSERGGAVGFVVPNRPPAEDWKRTSLFLRDLVAYANLAHRHKHMGDFIFCGWQPHGAGESASSKTSIHYRSGLMLSMVSQVGFWNLETAWRTHKALKHPGHVDLALKKYFSDPEQNWGTYIHPPLGGYSEHVSGCERVFYEKPRPSIWFEDFACPGTRAEHDWQRPARQRILYRFTVNSKADWLCKLNVSVPDSKVTWLTCDKRDRLGYAKPSGGWSTVQFDPETKKMTEWTERQLRSSRQLRMREKFRTFVPDDPYVQAGSTCCKKHMIQVLQCKAVVDKVVGTQVSPSGEKHIIQCGIPHQFLLLSDIITFKCLVHYQVFVQMYDGTRCAPGVSLPHT